MLTGDENIVNIDFSVFWVIKDAGKFLFEIQDPEGTVKAVIVHNSQNKTVGVISQADLLKAVIEGGEGE